MDLQLDVKTTAIVVIDLEHGIVARDLAPHNSADVIKNCVAIADALRSAGGTVVYVHVLLSETLTSPADAPWPKPPVIPPQASELVPEINLQASDKVILKRQWGAFYGTELDQHLRRQGVKTIIMAGIATNFGVESTARDAAERGYALVFAEDAMSSMKKELHTFATENIFPIIGKVRSTKQILKAIG